MSRFFKGFGLVLLVLVGLFYVACVPDRWSWHQKVSLVVGTPEGEQTAYAVSRVGVSKLDRSWVFIEARGANTSVSGEAVVLEVMPGKYLFGLLKGAHHEGNANWLADVFRDKGSDETSEQFWSRIDHSRLSTNLSGNHMPLLVTFTDITDPSTVKRVDPNDLESHFGAGVVLKAVTLEITGEKVTRGRVEKVLGWLSKYPEPGLCKSTGQTTNIPFCRRVYHGDIIRR